MNREKHWTTMFIDPSKARARREAEVSSRKLLVCSHKSEGKVLPPRVAVMSVMSWIFSTLFTTLFSTHPHLFSALLFSSLLTSSHLVLILLTSSQFLSSLINSSQLFLPLLDSSHLFPIFPPLASQFFSPFLTYQLFLRDPHLFSTHFPLLISSHLLKSCLNAPQVFSRPVLKPLLLNLNSLELFPHICPTPFSTSYQCFLTQCFLNFLTVLSGPRTPPASESRARCSPFFHSGWEVSFKCSASRKGVRIIDSWLWRLADDLPGL